MANRARFLWLTGAAAILTLSAVAGCGDDDEPTGSSGKGGSVGRGGTGARSGAGGSSGKGGTGGAGGAVGKGGTGGGGAGGTAGGGAGGTAGRDGGTPDGAGGAPEGGGGAPEGGGGAPDGSAGTDGGGTAGTAGDGGSLDASGEAATAATCASYCATLGANCSGQDNQYTTTDQCEKACAFFPKGTIGATSGNSLECRATYAALASGDKANCDRAGPAGVGTCGTPCQAFCNQMAAVCPTSLADAGNCETYCGRYPDASLTNFQAPAANGDTLACVLQHVNNASQYEPNDNLRASHCGHAAGAPTPCGPPP